MIHNKCTILFILFVAGTILLNGCNNKSDVSSISDESIAEQISSESIIETTSKSQETELNSNENASISEVPLVETQCEVEENNLSKPSSINGNEVFVGWKEDDKLSEPYENSSENDGNISLTAESKDISDTINALYNDTIYAEKSSEYITVPVVIGGNTDFSILELEISFDEKIFSFDSFTYTDDDALCNYTEDGKILISFVSTDNISGQVDICDIKFKNIGLCDTDTSLEYNVKDIAKWNDDKTGYIDAEYEIINNKIVMY